MTKYHILTKVFFILYHRSCYICTVVIAILLEKVDAVLLDIFDAGLTFLLPYLKFT